MIKLLVAMIAFSLLAACASGGSNSKRKEAELAQIYTDMGLGYMQKGDYGRAKEKLDQALNINPDMPHTHHYLAELYNRQEDFVNAEKHYKRTLELSPDDPNVHNNYAVFLCARERMDEAEAMFLQAIKTPGYQTPELAYENLGLCAVKVGNKEKAEQYFSKALKVRPNLPTSLYHMADLSFAKKDAFKARAYLERYLAVGATSPEVLWLGVRVERALGDKDMETQYGDLLRLRFPDSEQTKMLAVENSSSDGGHGTPHASATGQPGDNSK